MTNHSFSRRSFLGIGAVGALAAGASLCGCAPKAAGSASESGASDSKSGGSQGGQWSWLANPEPISDIKGTDTYDIVIVGGGIAGMTAAWAAASQGSKVALIEKTGQLNGRSLMAGCINASIQNQRGVTFDTEEVVEELRRFMGGYTNTDLLRMYVNNSGKAFDALAELSEAYGGEPFYWGGGTPYAVNTAGIKEYNTPMGPAATMADMLTYLQEDAEKTGLFTLLLNTEAVQLAKEDSKVVGVVVKTSDGHQQLNGTNGVIMATGDYGGNEEMIEAWSPMVNRYVDVNLYTPAGANNGDGLKMMMWAGAAMQPITEHAPMIGSGGAVGSVNPFLRVNANGERYENEAAVVSQILSGSMMQPQGLAWTIFDADCATYAEQQTIFNMAKDASNFADEAIAEAVKKKTLVSANSLSELAEAIGVPADALESTVERYNGYCETGVDEEYRKPANNLTPVKKAPFYAAQVIRELECMMGGISVDKHLRVLNDEGAVVEGLYAIGNCSGNYFAVDYPAIIVGQSHGRAITQGYLMGNALAAGNDGVSA